MSSLSHRLSMSVAIAALMGASMLVTPLTGALAGSTVGAPIRLVDAAAPKNSAAAGATETKAETVEDRIANLHSALKITSDQETKWNGVAQAMRENAAAMDKLVEATHATPPADKTAVQDLKTYEEFAQAHVNGLKNLIASFNGLYNSMPDAQKKNADEVFKTSGRENAPSRS